MHPPKRNRYAVFMLLIATIAVCFASPALVSGATGARQSGPAMAEGSAANGRLAPVVVRRPDGRIRVAATGYPGKTRPVSSSFIGNNIYNTTALHQQATESGYADLVDAFFTWEISVQNDGTRPDAFKLKATGAANPYWTIRYLHGSSNLTPAVLAGTFMTPTLAPGATYVIRATITVVGSSDVTRLVTIRSAADATKVDAVRFTFKKLSCGC